MSIRKKKLSTLNWLFILASMLVVVFLLSKTPIKNLPCANTGSCDESTNLIVDNSEIGIFEGNEVVPPKIYISTLESKPKVLGIDSSPDEKHVYVDLSTQTLKALQGNDIYMEANISSGKWFPTPTGDFVIWKKIRATKMSGGEGADYYYLPNVPYVMFFSNNEVSSDRGFGFHGAYWHNNFGHAMSHGCINMRIIDAEKLYNWVNPVAEGNDTNSNPDNPGTKITIYGKAP